MKRWFYSGVIFFVSQNIFAQSPTFSNDVAPIIFNYCTNCHRSGNIAPFPLTTYDEVAGAAFSMLSAINNKKMPPWMPDPNYSHFINERVLNEVEIQLINDWVSNGMPEGDSVLTSDLPIFYEGSEIGVPDIQFELPHFTKSIAADEYRCFVVSTGFAQDVFIKSFEFLPGNKLMDHHAEIFWDTTGTCQQLDLLDSLPGYLSAGGNIGSDYAQLLFTWVPGTSPFILPEDFAFKIPAGADIVIQLHYAPGTQGLTDSSELNLFYSFQPQVRVLKTIIANHLDNDLQNGPFIIPPDSIKTFHAVDTLTRKISFLGVMPHMHLLGDHTITYAVSPSNDTLKIISIPFWNFKWQSAYMFQKILVSDSGSVFHTESTYNNTSFNLSNPFYPPQTVNAGFGINSEMMLSAYYYVNYKVGDENIFLNSINDSLDEDKKYFTIFPNPSNGNFVLKSDYIKAQKISVLVLNVQGVVVKSLFDNVVLGDGNQIQFCDLDDLPAGMYFLKISSDSLNEIKRIVVFH